MFLGLYTQARGQKAKHKSRMQSLAKKIGTVYGDIFQFNPCKLMEHALWLERDLEEKIPIHQGLMKVREGEAERKRTEEDLVRNIANALVGHQEEARLWLPQTLKLAKEAHQSELPPLAQAEAFKRTLSTEIAEMKQTLSARSEERLAAAMTGAKEAGLVIEEGTDAAGVHEALARSKLQGESKKRKLEASKWDCTLAQGAAKCARMETEEGTPNRFKSMGVPPSERFASLGAK